MAITPTNSLLTALSGLGIDGAKPRPTTEAARPMAPAPQSKAPQAATQAAAPDPSRPLPRGSLVNIVI